MIRDVRETDLDLYTLPSFVVKGWARARNSWGWAVVREGGKEEAWHARGCEPLRAAHVPLSKPKILVKLWAALKAIFACLTFGAG